MIEINLKDIKIEMPKDFNGKPSNFDISEWLEFEFGVKPAMKMSNPLHIIELKDCIITVGGSEIDITSFNLTSTT